MSEAAPPVRQISSRDNPLLVRIRKLAADPTAYRKAGEVWIEGEHLCGAFASRGTSALHAVIGETAWREQPHLRALAQHSALVHVVADALLAGLSSLESPPAIGFVIAWPGAASAKAGQASVVLDRLQDAGNVGTILRSAAAFGFRQVIALSGTAALWSPKVVRAAMGAHFALALVEQADVESLATLGVPLLATGSHAADSIAQTELPWPCAWVLGHEGQGVSAALAARCAQTLRIPQPGGEESLNVAAAAAICLYESSRQRGDRDHQPRSR